MGVERSIEPGFPKTADIFCLLPLRERAIQKGE